MFVFTGITEGGENNYIRKYILRKMFKPRKTLATQASLVKMANNTVFIISDHTTASSKVSYA
jgi:hypothetical protein